MAITARRPMGSGATYTTHAHSRRRGVRVAIAGLELILLVLISVGVVAGRPHVTWELTPSNNEVTISLEQGEGPFAPWLLSQSTVSTAAGHGSQMTLEVPDGRATSIHVSMRSIWSTPQTLLIDVPPRPVLVSTSMDASTVTLRFSIPITPLNSPCGLPESLTSVTSLIFPRSLVTCSALVDVITNAGEQAQVAFTIPGLPPPPPPTPSPLPKPRPLPPAPATYFANADGGAFYITIDDGYTPDPAVITLMQAGHVPITTFLIADIAAKNLDFWRQFAAAGGDIENHTVSHADLGQLSESAAQAEWTGASSDFRSWFHVSPTIGRPPYGNFNSNVQVAAGQAGLRWVVLWSASMYNGKLTTYDHGPLRAGEIVILHWIPGMYQSLVRLLQLAAAQGLHPAPLLAGLA